MSLVVIFIIIGSLEQSVLYLLTCGDCVTVSLNLLEIKLLQNNNNNSPPSLSLPPPPPLYLLNVLVAGHALITPCLVVPLLLSKPPS